MASAAPTVDMEERKKALFKKGLRIDGTHTRMSAEATGDYKTIPGDGWCLYSAFLVAFEKYTLIMEGDSTEKITVDGVEETRGLFRYALAAQFARYLATEIQEDPDLRRAICESILTQATELVINADKATVQIRPIYTAAGETKELGYLLDEPASDSDVTWVHGKGTDNPEKFKYVRVGTLETLLSGIDGGACNSIDIDGYLLNIWKPREKDSAYLPMMFGTYDWFMAAIRKLYGWIQMKRMTGTLSDTPITNPMELGDTGIVYHLDRIPHTDEVVTPLIDKDSAHFNSVVYEYVPLELDVFPVGSTYFEAAKAFVAADSAGRKEMIGEWEAEWNQVGGNVMPPAAVANAPVMPAEEDPLKEAATVVSDLMRAVADAGGKILATPISPVPNQPPLIGIPAISGGMAITPSEPESTDDIALATALGEPGTPSAVTPAPAESFADFLRKFPVLPEWKNTGFNPANLPIPSGNIDVALAKSNHDRIKGYLNEIIMVLNTFPAFDALKGILTETIGLKYSLEKIYELLGGDSDRATTRGKINGVIIRINKMLEALVKTTGQSGQVAGAGGGPQQPSPDDKKDILTHLDQLEAFVGILPGDTGNPLKAQIDDLQLALLRRDISVTNLRAELAAVQQQQGQLTAAQQAEFADIQDRFRRLDTVGGDQQAQIQELMEGLQRLQAAVDAKALQTDVTALREQVTTAGLGPRVTAIEKRLGELSDQIGAPPSGAVADTIAQLRADLDQLAAAGGAQAQIATMKGRLDAIEGRVAPVSGATQQPLSLAAVTTRVDQLVTNANAAIDRLSAVEKQNEATQAAVAGIRQELDALRAVKDEMAAKQAATGVTKPIQLPQQPEVDAGERPSWFLPGKGQTAGRIAADVSGFDQILTTGWQNERARDPQQQRYRDMMDDSLNPPKGMSMVSGTYNVAAKAHKDKKIAAAFPDRTVFIDGAAYTVRNPYAAFKQRLDAAEGVFVSKTLPAEGDPLRLNAEVLQAYAPVASFGEYLADNRKAIAVLESLWHCGNQQGADVDPKCFPARVIEELREYQQVTQAQDALRSALLQKTGMPVLISHLRKLRAMLRPPPPPAAMIPEKMDEKPAVPLGPAPPGPAPSLRKKPLLSLAPGLGARRVINIGGRDVTFRPQVIPPLAPGLGSN